LVFNVSSVLEQAFVAVVSFNICQMFLWHLS